MDSATENVTQLLQNLKSGDAAAEAKLISVVYDELRRLAGHYMRQERPDHTLQATALVHEAFLRLTDDKGVGWQGRAHFFGVAAKLMRRILIDHARARVRVKRGGGGQKLSLDEGLVVTEARSAELLALNNAVEHLRAFDARQARIVELRFFGGLTVEETAQVLGISPKTVKREWSTAKEWLRRDLKVGAGNPTA